MAYNKNIWTNSNLPGISADNLNHIEQGIEDAHNSIETINANTSDLSLKKLWENENPADSFASQNIILNSSDYDYLIIFWLNYKNTNRLDTTFTLKNYGAYLNLASDYSNGGNTYYVSSYVREFNRNSDISFTFDNCYVRYGNSTTRLTSNENIIPVFIYGGKFLEVANE